ncbi:MAG: NF038122 family metalloprotease [Acidobacteria bacterium]|nr:NF038122 family metalloprotease [Acidobacteriota bacterium]
MKRTFLTSLLSFLLVFAGPASLNASAQSAAPSAGKDSELQDAYVLYQNERGETVCREANLAERRDILERRRAELRTIYSGAAHRGAFSGGDEKFTANATTTSDQPAMNLLPSAGLRIVLHGTAQLEQHPAAKQAFIVAANRWESLISTPITVVIDVDFGVKFFNAATDYPTGVLGQTGSSSQVSTISNVHGSLNQSATNAGEAALYNALPSASVPIEFGGATSSVTNVRMTFANARALGLRSDIANPDAVALMLGDAGIGFNSAFGFDFTPDDGIDSDKTDFDAVAVHEIGHALGFSSSSGGTNTPTSLSLLDVFRFRPGTGSLATLATAPRVMALGGEQVFFNNHTSTHAATLGATELGLSTGGPSGDSTTGDGRQSSHWKDDALVLPARPFIGIMDPNIGRGQRKQISDNDLKAFDTFGYSIGGALPPPPAVPANDNFVNAVELQGPTGSVNGTNVAATKEAGEPDHADVGGVSVWYRWTAPGTGQATFNTEGSNYDTMLGVYTGASVGGLSLVIANDDVQNGVIRTSTVTFTATAGTTYRIAVDGWHGETGQIKLNWTAPGQAVHTISGRIVSACCEQTTDATNITVTLSGSQSGTTQTDAGGFYSFQNLAAGGNYTVTPTKTGATFTPASATFNNLAQNQTAPDFTAARLTFLISGQARDPQGNAIAGATVVLSKQVPDSPLGIPSFRDTDAAGNVSFIADPGGNYTVSISKPGFVFLDPRTFIFSNLSANQAVTFTARRLILSGRVTDGSGNNIGGATVSLTGPRAAATITDAEGRYSFEDLPTGTYTLSPSKAGQFVAFAQNVNLFADQSAVELRLTPFINITGRVTDGAGNPLTGAGIRLGSQFFAQAVNADGSYSINISPTVGAPVTLLAEKFGYQFAPPSVTFTGVAGGNQVVNFSGTLGNRIDGSQFFAAQHYRDFLGREADAGGLAFWTRRSSSCSILAICGGTRTTRRTRTTAVTTSGSRSSTTTAATSVARRWCRPSSTLSSTATASCRKTREPRRSLIAYG